MKKGVRITAWILGLLLLLQVGVVVVLQSPAVQTWLGRKVIGMLQEKMDADITFESASVRPFDALVLDGVVVVDHNPTVAGMDTVMRVQHLSARFSLMGLLRGDNIKIRRANLDGGSFYLTLEEDPARPGKTTTNLQRIFRMKHKDKPGYHWGNLLEANNLEVRDIHFRMENIPGAERMAARGSGYGEGAIDWNHLDLDLEHLKVNHLTVANDLISCDVRDLRIHERETGLLMEGLSARKVVVGKARVNVEELKGRLSPGTVLNVSSLEMLGTMDNYSEFVDSIRLNIHLAEGSVVDMRTIRHFGPHMEEMGFRGNLRGKMSGTVSDFRLTDIVADGVDEDIHLMASGRMQGLPEVDDTRLNFQIQTLRFSMKSLGKFVRDWTPDVKTDGLEKLAPGETFTLSGNVDGTLNAMTVGAGVTSRIGDALADVYIRNVMDKQRSILIGGDIDTDRLHLGSLLGQKDLGPVTMKANLDAVFPRKGSMSVQLDSMHVARLHALGYDYSDIGISGNYRASDFEVNLRSGDPNLLLAATGVYHEDPDKDGHMDVDLKLDRADLKALNLDSREGASLLALNASAHLVRNDAHTEGKVTARDVKLINDTGTHPVEDITLRIDALDSLHRMDLHSEMLQASYRGDKDIASFVKDLKGLIIGDQLSALSDEPLPYSGASYSANVEVHRIQDLLDFAVPGMYVEDGTKARLTVSHEGRLKADVTSGRIALGQKYIKDLKLNLDNADKTLVAEVTGSTVALGSTHLNNNRLTFYAADNNIGLGYTFDNETEADTRAELYLTGGLDRDEKGLGVSVAALPSNFYYMGNGWGISSGDITYKAGRLHIDKLLARHEEQQLLVDGGYAPGKADTLSLTMDRFELGLVNTIAGEGLPPMEGQLTGRARVVSSAGSSTPMLLAGVVCDSTSLGGQRIGQIRLSSIWDDPGKRFRVRVRNQLDGREPLSAEASISPSTKQIQGEVKLNRFGMGVAEPFMNTLFHEFDGALSGELSLGGKWDNLQITSRDLRLDDGIICPDFTRVPYHANGSLSLDNKGLHFVDVSVTDGEKGTGRIFGSILFNLKNLQDVRMDTHLRLNDMHALALERGVNPYLWGDIYAGGKVDITGTLNRITLALDVANAREGEFHLPISSSSSGKSTEMLSFTQPPEVISEDPYELMMATQKDKRKRKTDLIFTGRVTATPNLQVNLDLDEESSLTAFGNGTIEIDYRMSQSAFTLGGDYAITDGSFHFSAMNLVNRKFTIQDGSSIRFNGDVWDTDLDVKGRYTTKASLSNLIPSYDEGASAARHTVYCGINISGRIKNPVVDFDIDVPDLNPIVQTQVESALNSEDKVQKQFVYLLLAGNFLPTEESGVTTNGSDVLYSNVSSIMSGQLNNIFQKLDIPLDFGLNYQTTQAGLDLFDVAVSTQLFNNRVIVNGTVGNKQVMGGLTTNEIAGDLDVEIKLNRSGSLRMSLFSHSADQYTYYLDTSQRNGGGIAYQREFNSLVQFFKELFSSPARREQMALEAAKKPVENTVLTIDENGKSHEQ